MENSKRPRVLLFNLVHKQCNGLVKRWLHCLTSESKERFLVKNVLVFASVRAQIQFFLLKKYKKKKIQKKYVSVRCHYQAYLFGIYDKVQF